MKVAPRSREDMLRAVFSEPMYEVHTLDQKPLPTGDYKGFNDEELRDTLMLKDALRMAKKINNDAHVIVIKDNSVTNGSAATINSSVQNTLSHTFDICYLCKWNDKCQLYTSVDKTSTATPALVNTKSPNGIQAMIFSPNGRDVVLGVKNMANGKPLMTDIPINNRLNQEIYNGNIKATCLVPNLFEFDIILNAEHNSDYAKLSQCLNVGVGNPEPSSGGNLLWFILIVVVVILVAWAILALTWRKKKDSQVKNNNL